MPTWLVWAIALTTAACSAGAQQVHDVAKPRFGCLVYHYGFNVERITGIPEEQIEQYGCRYRVPEPQFLSLLRGPNSAWRDDYEPRNVRAKVVCGEGRDVHYIDRDGRVRVRDRYFTISRDELVRILPEPESCPER